jgi:hypothetical protein
MLRTESLSFEATTAVFRELGQTLDLKKKDEVLGELSCAFVENLLQELKY